MQLCAVLKEAQRLLAGDAKNGPGWTGPEHAFGYCQRKRGENALGLPMIEPCWWNDEAIWRFTLEAALRIAARCDEALFEAAWDSLRAVVAPSIVQAEEYFQSLPPLTQDSWPKHRLWLVYEGAASKQLDLREWLQQSERTLGEVLKAFDTAVLKVRSYS